MPTNIGNLSDTEHAKWHAFIDAVNAAVESCFADEDRPTVVIGAQWGDMGRDSHPDLPVCVVTSNLPVCLTSECIKDMYDFAEAAHDEYHGLPMGSDDGNVVKEVMDPSKVPDEIRQKAIEWAESLGYTAEHVQFIEVADTSDLNDLPLFDVPADTLDEFEAEFEDKG